ncbi:hypothetical protein GAMM_40290 [Gammaproteobacteria bacterium]
MQNSYEGMYEKKAVSSYTSQFRDAIDYKEAFANKGKGPIFIGHRPDLAEYYNDIDKEGDSSMYYGCVLYPESPTRKDGRKWTYEKNQAFWAGAIDSNRDFLLINNINDYKMCGGTIDELLWLKDNGYEFSMNEDNTVLATPSVTIRSEEHIIINYSAMKTQDKIDKFYELQKQIIGSKALIDMSPIQSLIKSPPIKWTDKKEVSSVRKKLSLPVKWADEKEVPSVRKKLSLGVRLLAKETDDEEVPQKQKLLLNASKRIKKVLQLKRPPAKKTDDEETSKSQKKSSSSDSTGSTNSPSGTF